MAPSEDIRECLVSVFGGCLVGAPLVLVLVFVLVLVLYLFKFRSWRSGGAEEIVGLDLERISVSSRAISL